MNRLLRCRNEKWKIIRKIILQLDGGDEIFFRNFFPKTNFLVNATIEREELKMRENFLRVFNSSFELKIERKKVNKCRSAIILVDA